MTNELLLRCYQDAALQLHLMRPVADDGADKTFYAIDSNVIYSYLDPDEHRPSLPMDVGRFFHFDEEDTRNAIARRLMTMLLEALSPRAPFIMLAPIYGETKKILDDYLEHAAGVTDSAKREAQRIFQQLSDGADAALPIDQELIERALRQESRVVLERFHRLVRGRRLLPDARVTASTHSAAIATVLAPSRSIEEMVQFSQLKLAWQKRLRDVGRDETSRSEHDAIALTQIELANHRLAGVDAGERLHYITQDSSLLRAGEGYVTPDSEGRSFTQLYLRHPRAFVDEIRALEPLQLAKTGHQQTGNHQTISEWLTVLLGRFEEDLAPLRLGHTRLDFPRHLTAKIRDVASANPDAAEDIRTTWSKFAEASAEEPGALLARLRQAVKSRHAADIDALVSEIEEGERHAWEAVLEAGIAARFTVEVKAPDEIVAREAPALIFDGRPALSAFLMRARRWLDDYASYDFEEYRRLRLEVRSEDESGYGDFLAHAYLLAEQGQWRTAAIIARFATENAPSATVIEPSGSNGRESRYLEAHSLRVLAHTAADLQTPLELIEKAEALAQAENDAGWPCFDPVLERFEVERLAIEVARIQFAWLDHDGHESELAVQGLSIADRYATLARRLRARLPDVTPDIALEAARADVLTRCCRGAIALHLQFGDLRELHDPFDDLHAVLAAMHEPRRRRAEITDAILMLYSAARSTPTAALRRMLHNFAIKHHANPFDQARFDHIVRRILDFYGDRSAAVR